MTGLVGGRLRYPQRWLVLSALAPLAGEEFLMLDVLRRLGARAVAREGQRVLAWLLPPADIDQLLHEAEAALRIGTSPTDPSLTWYWQSHDEWSERWKQTLAPRRVTDRIVVAPTDADFEHGGDDNGDVTAAAANFVSDVGDVVDNEGDAVDNEGDVVIRLEPGMAFGTAEHGTTRGCLRLVEAIVRSGDRVVDIGTGSGILAIAAALFGARHVLALEADPLSALTARRNVAVNGVTNRVIVRAQTVGPGDLQMLAGRAGSPPLNGPADTRSAHSPTHPRLDVILANLEADLIGRLLPDCRETLAPRGCLIVSGITGGERLAFIDTAAAEGFEVHVQDHVDGWWCATLRPIA
ncbi:hypothetical protein BH23GEM9_BH23GEM9_07380 [soil metagenome]